MSKEKAKEKAKRKLELRLQHEQDLKNNIDSAKIADTDKAHKHKIRNAEATATRKLIKNRIEQSKSPAFRFAGKQQNVVLDAVIATIGEDRQLAYDFLLEEIEAASVGNNTAKEFALNSGVSEKQYRGALNRTILAVEKGPQLALIRESNIIREHRGIEFSVITRLAVIDKVMQLYELGKYSNSSTPTPISSEDAKSSANEEKLRDLFKEYFEYCNHPKRFGTTHLTSMILQVCVNIESPSELLQDHLLLIRMISLAGNKVRSAKIPPKLKIDSDLNTCSFLEIESWLEIVKTFSNLVTKDKLIRSLDLCRQVNITEQRHIINFAPAIYNSFNLIYAEHSRSDYLESIRSFMVDSTFVFGSMKGSLGLMGEVKKWAASI
ncbi:hypothetical protein [Pseudomonas fluorescens]|uniref:Uncharacterized protein n=1 Tax=Pseudomonas fluorescens TaxID=294 RepID=A0A5E7D1B4_PSEFL|nr:hypothetical protein [Pseudomonas fluorescens]VVO01382.1 hypothetical protein PS691_02658 [Pseudomonas fluorescens]